MLGNDTIVIYKPNETTDPDGSVNIPFDLNPAHATLLATVPGCSVQPFLLADKLQFEDNVDRRYASTTYRVFAPPGTVVKYSYWVLYNTEMYEVFGHAGPWRNLDGYADHVEFLMRYRRG